MKYQKTITSIVFLFIGLGGLYAQENTTASGGEATGTGGSSSYSIGQVAYITLTGTNGSVAQGIQQPFQISVTTGLDAKTINLEISIYPNPTIDNLVLKVKDVDKLNYQLFNSQGKLIETKIIHANSTTINTKALPKAIYFLKVIENNTLVKTFKIIKN